jgi:hypothetical protein
MRSICASVLFLVLAPGCALSHLRTDPGDVPDAAASDAAVADAGHTDAGPITSCSEFWTALTWCPAIPSEVVGHPCGFEGQRCGFGCCEASPPVACVGGVWTMSDEIPDCRGVRCRPPTPCGAGSCAFGTVCVHPSTEIRVPDHCVVPPAPIDSCSDVPPGALGGEPRSCSHCLCDDAAGPVEIVLTCDCCDSASAAP